MTIRKLLGHSVFQVAGGIAVGVLAGAMGIFGFTSASSQAHVRPAAPPTVSSRAARLADFGDATPSQDARSFADWVATSNDAGRSAFLIVDKKDAKLYVFGPDAKLVSASPILLGLAKGDESEPGIGSRPLDQLRPEERTTPAGRFIGQRGHDARGEDVVWVDYESAVAIHRVLTTNPAERRLQRLATPTNADKRISSGCINVPVVFYETYVRPIFANHRAIVYVLPEIKSLQQVFNNFHPRSA